MNREAAYQIWRAICCHDGFAEDRGEWCIANMLDRDDVDEFESFIDQAIENLSDADE